MVRMPFVFGFLLACLMLASAAPLRAQTKPPDSLVSSQNPLAMRDELAQQVRGVTEGLAGLSKRIDETSEIVKNNADPAAAKQQIDALRNAVAELLTRLADNGTAAQLGQSALDHVRHRLGELQQDMHFAPDQKERLLREWRRVAKDTEDAVGDLDAARKEMVDLLRLLQTNEDYLAALEELRQASENVDAIRKLTADLHDMAARVRDLHNRINVPSM
ncbi:MAG: hypothetical protein JO305_04475 [Alphaproteobacteria bacterium]|nr:hypothetical protein [Alphaproteobacteria bacterium]